MGTAPEFVDEVKKALVEKYGAKTLPTLGMTVVTTCDARIQKLAREAVEKGLVDLDARQGYRKPLAHLKTPQQMQAHEKKLAKEFPAGPSRDKIVEGVITGAVVGGEVGDGGRRCRRRRSWRRSRCAGGRRRRSARARRRRRSRPRRPRPTAAELKAHDADGATVSLGATQGWLPLPAAIDRYNPKGLIADRRFAVGDVIRVRVIDYPKDKPAVLALELGPQAAVVVMDPNTREVKAIVGGYGYRPGGFDRALSGEAAAGLVVQAVPLHARRSRPRSGRRRRCCSTGRRPTSRQGSQPWKPQNAEKEEFMGPIRLRVALARSLNTVALQLVDTSRGGVDPAVVASLAHDLGIESNLEAMPSLALGTSEVCRSS